MEALNKSTVNRLRKFGRRLSVLRREARAAEAEMKAAHATALEARRQVQGGLDTEDPQSLPKAVEDAGTLVTNLRRRVQIAERLDQLDRRRKGLEETSHESLDRQLPSSTQYVYCLVFFSLGVGMFVTSLIFHSMMHGYGLVFGFLGAIAAVVSAFTTFGSSHVTERQLDDCQAQLNQIEKQLAALEKERDELDRKLPKGGGPLTSRLQTAEQDLAKLEELMPLTVQHKHGVRTFQAAKSSHKNAMGEYQKARRQWQKLLAAYGLPRNLSLAMLREMVRRRKQWRAEARLIEQRRAQLAECHHQHELLGERIHQVAIDSRVDTKETEPVAMLREMLRRLQDEQQRMQARDILRTRQAALPPSAAKTG